MSRPDRPRFDPARWITAALARLSQHPSFRDGLRWIQGRVADVPSLRWVSNWSLLVDIARVDRFTAALEPRLRRDVPPVPSGGAVRFLVLCMPRTGSNLLTTELDRRWREIRCRGEEYDPAIRGAATVSGITETVFTATRDHPITGCKLFYRHLDAPDLETILRLDGMRVVHLRRRNRLRRFVSWKIAQQTQEWIVVDDQDSSTIEDRAVRIDVDEFLRNCRYTLNSAHRAMKLLASTGVPVLDVWYEDLCRDVDGEARRVATFLGAREPAVAGTPRTRRQNPEPLALLVRNYDELRRALWRTYMRIYLDAEDRRPARGARTCWPTEAQELALGAALAPPDHVGDAFLRWSNVSGVSSIDELDPGTRRLMPMIYRNLRRASVRSALDAELRRSYVDSSAQNQRLLRTLEGLLHDLDRAGVPTLVLKGAALTILHYRDRGTRPMSDLDVLVPPDMAEAAYKVLHAAGWEYLDRRSDTPIGPLLEVRHAVALRRDAQQLDLHWYATAESVGTDLDDQLWNAAVELVVGTQVTRALAPADQLLHAFVHGLRYNPLPPVRWIADAHVVATSAGSDVDWQRLAALAEQYRLVPPVRAGAEYLADRFPGVIPPELLQRVRSLPISGQERRAFKHLTQAHWLLGSGRSLWRQHRRRAPDEGPLRAAAGFADDLRVVYDLDRISELPARVWAGIRHRRHRDRDPQ